jgi:hypothetical protein
MKWRPSPAIIGYPCPSIIGINPMPVTIIRPETTNVRPPYITIILVIHPTTIRA